MKKIRLKNIIAGIELLLALLVPGGAAYADDSPISAMVISPMYQKIILVPGESREMSISISNPNSSQYDLQYTAYVGSFSQGLTQDNHDVDSTTVTEQNQIMEWITLDKDSGSIAPNETDILTFTINVPYNAPAGGQYASILVQDDTSKTIAGAKNVNIESNVQIMSIIYAEIAGETINTGEIYENYIPTMLLSNKLEATSLVKNTGNVHTDADYTLQVWPMFSDEEICTNEEEPGQSLIMPGMEQFHTETCELPMVGVFRAKQTVKIFGEISIVEKTIFVCPLWLLFLIIFAIIALIMWFFLIAKKRKTSRR